MTPKFTLTGHARFQMRARRVTEADIAQVLENYDTRRPAPSRAAKPAEIFIGYSGERRLKVYVERGSDPPKVKTVAWEGD